MSEGKKLTASILVKDNSVDDIYKSEIYPFLRSHGFVLLALKDYPVCNWIYISLTDKTYIPGIPGIPVTQALGNHAITVNEFYEIFRIFEKYDGLSILNMSSRNSSTPGHKPALTVADEKKQIPLEPIPIIGTVYLVSQTMNISIDIFDNGEVEEDGEKLFQYRFVAKDEATMQSIDVDLEDSVSEYSIRLLRQALEDTSFDDTVSTVYSWGHIEFSFAKKDGHPKMMIFVYIDGSPDEEDTDNVQSQNYFYIEFEEKEFEKFKDFILSLDAIIDDSML